MPMLFFAAASSDHVVFDLSKGSISPGMTMVDSLAPAGRPPPTFPRGFKFREV